MKSRIHEIYERSLASTALEKHLRDMPMKASVIVIVIKYSDLRAAKELCEPLGSLPAAAAT
jgi:hypothetical protein